MKKTRTDGELLALLLELIATLAWIASNGTTGLLQRWLHETATRYSLVSGMQVVLDQVNLDERTRSLVEQVIDANQNLCEKDVMP